MRIIFTLLVFFLPATSHALTLLSINAEWFWDELEPHEGRVAFETLPGPPSKEAVEREARAIAKKITARDADIVGLIEVENKAVVARILPYLNSGWSIVFKQGRDSITGQDVAILTRLTVHNDTITTFSNIRGQFDSTKARPSKVLGAVLSDKNGIRYRIILAHLISKAGDNDQKRAAQADAISIAVRQRNVKFDHTILMGDLNDTPDSTPLSLLLRTGLNQIASANDYSYIHDNNKELIDHILISDSLVPNATFKTFPLDGISDHRGVYANVSP